MRPGSSHRAAIPAQQSCNNNGIAKLVGRDGINKTVVWKK
jgi:hypothetical protein